MRHSPSCREMTEEEAVKFYKSNWWEDYSDEYVALVQLSQSRLCMPFGEFHLRCERAAGVSIWSHEFIKPELISRMIVTKVREKDPFFSLLEILEENNN